jgi:hypothetical protein
MNSTLNKIAAGVYITQLLYRCQISNMAHLLPAGEETEFRNEVFHGEVGELYGPKAAQCFNTVRAIAVGHLGLLQAIRLHADLFTPGVLAVATRHLLEEPDIDWNDVGCLLTGTAEQFKLDSILAEHLERPLCQMSGDAVRDALKQAVGMFENARSYDETFVKTSVFRYADLWTRMFHNPRELMRALDEVGVKQGPDDSEDVNAMANIMGGEPDGVFEAFCIRHSLGLETAKVWEEQMVTWGYREYAGATRGMMADGRAEFKTFMASAVAAGYPVYIQDKHLSDFEDLLLRIPGCTTDEERDMVENFIYCIAPILFFELSEHGQYRNARWRGISVSSDYDTMIRELENYEGSGWLPLVRLLTMRFANRRFDRQTIFSTYEEEVKEQIERATLNANVSQATRRHTYLVQELLRVIEDDMYDMKLFGHN